VPKQGRFIPGVHVPIDRTEPLHNEMADYELLLAWFSARRSWCSKRVRARGGRFIVPVPEPRIC
jgi:C-methyltransferase C-terminal domain